MTVLVKRTEPLGAVVEAIDLSAPPNRLFSDLPRLLAEHGVIVFRDQTIDDGGFASFLRSLGPLAFTVGRPPSPASQI